MKVVERARLGFREGNSDKVYEVDLVEVATDQYVVNFRFGRRGTALRDGTKTPLPLSLARARAVFESLVAEKTRGGYRPLAEGAVSETRAAPAPDDARTARELLKALGLGLRSERPLHLVVRELGERGSSEAEPLLLELLASGAAPPGMKLQVLQHFLVLALARCGSARALAPLRAFVENRKTPRHLADAARLALRMIGGETERQALLATVPGALRVEAGAELEPRLRELEGLLSSRPAQAHAVVFAHYLSAPATSNGEGTEAERTARRLALSVARVARLRGQELGLVRTLNWASEVRRDGELFALLARRFEAAQGAGAPPAIDYFRRRAGRALRRLARIRSADYVKMATELLLLYTADDAEEALATEWGTWDAFGRYHALNCVIYGSSPRYERARASAATWRCRASYAVGQPPPGEREEAHPELWDQAPESLWRLAVSTTAASVVIQFATRALREQHAFLARLSDEALAGALAAAQRPMQLLSFDVARQRPPNLVLARAALAARIDAADDWVLAWVAGDAAVLARELELLALLVTAPGARVHAGLPALARGLTLDAEAERELVARCVGLLMQLTEEPSTAARVRCARAFLLAHAERALGGLGFPVLRDLLAHPVAEVAELGAELLWRRSRQGALPEGLVDTLLASPHAPVRSLGARIVAETPLAIMKDDVDLLVHLVLSPNAELREGTRELFAALSTQHPGVATAVASRLVDSLLAAQPPGVPAHVVSVLRRELASCLPVRDVAGVMALVGALSPHAREAGGLLLAQLSADDVELEAVVRLASHEILMVRQGAWALARKARERFRVTPVALARLCDARWPDSRDFAFGFVRSFDAKDLVPDAVIAICDSALPLVQAFGQSLLFEHFREEHAARYLVQLSEHPATGIQLLVSGLLERFGRGNLELLRQLLPCLTTILCQVNRGGVAKQRVLSFLRKEAVASPEAASLLAPLLERQSLTRAVSHRGPLIATLVDVHERYPEVPVPLTSAAIPLHARGGRGV
jgi:WGR domain